MCLCGSRSCASGGWRRFWSAASRGPKVGVCRGVKPKVIAALQAKLEANEFTTAEQARRWLKKHHKVERPYISVWRWLKKIAGVLRVPRPIHSRKKPGAEQEFKEALLRKARSART